MVVASYTPVATPVVPPPAGKAQHRTTGHRPELCPPVTVITPVGELELGNGALLIGRLPECDVLLNDSLVSRMHARISIQGEYVVLEDLHSINGVFVNGRKVNHSTVLCEGDRILIGTSELSLFESRDSSAVQVRPPASPSSWIDDEPALSPSPPPAGSQPIAGLQLRARPLAAPPAEPSPPPSTSRVSEDASPADKAPSTGRADALQLLGGLADRLVAMGNVDEAVEVLSGHLKRVLKGANTGLTVPSDIVHSASVHALKVARWTKLPLWADYVVELHLSARLLMSIDTLQAYEVTIAGLDFDRLLLAYYVESLADQLPTMTAAERVRVTHLASLLHED